MPKQSEQTAWAVAERDGYIHPETIVNTRVEVKEWSTYAGQKIVRISMRIIERKGKKK